MTSSDEAAAQEFKRWIAEQEAAMRAMLRELVEQSSFTDDHEGVRRALDLLEGALPEHWTRERVASDRCGGHLVVHGPNGSAEGRGVVLVGHIDTVFPNDVFAGYREEGERGRGPGVLDMKGGLVVTAFGLRAAELQGQPPPWTWVIVGDEEVGSPDGAPLLRARAKGASCALVFESGRAHDAIITRRKGTSTLVVTAHGVAAHAGNAHDRGRNALWSLARWIDAAQSLTDYGRGVTVNVGVLRGGHSKNTVPDRAVAEVDLRFERDEDRHWLREALERLALERALDGTRIELAWGPSRPPLERTEASAALREAYARCQREAGLGDGESPLVGGGSDASTTSAEGIASIDALGVRGEGFHTLHEYAELRTLAPKAEALARFLLRARREECSARLDDALP